MQRRLIKGQFPVANRSVILDSNWPICITCISGSTNNPSKWHKSCISYDYYKVYDTIERPYRIALRSNHWRRRLLLQIFTTKLTVLYTALICESDSQIRAV